MVEPRGDRRPGVLGRAAPHDQTEVARGQLELQHLRPGGGTPDPAHARRWGQLVPVAEDDQHRDLQVGERDHAPTDLEPTGQHAVVAEELLGELGQRRPRPRDEALAVEEATLWLAVQQRLTVVQLADEVDAGTDRLDRVEELEDGARQPARRTGRLEQPPGEA